MGQGLVGGLIEQLTLSLGKIVSLSRTTVELPLSAWRMRMLGLVRRERRAERSEELRESGGEFMVGNVSKDVGNVMFNRVVRGELGGSAELGGMNLERLG